MMLRPCVGALVAVVGDREEQPDVGEGGEDDDGAVSMARGRAVYVACASFARTSAIRPISSAHTAKM